MKARASFLTVCTAVTALAIGACQDATLAPDDSDSAPPPSLVVVPDGTTLGTADIDSNGDCEVSGLSDEFDDAHVRVAINRNWINATCQVQLDDSQLATLGGPFAEGQVYDDFMCFVGNDDDLEDIVSTMSHAVITPTGRLTISCQAPHPSNGLPNGLGTVDIDSNGDCEVSGLVDEFDDANVHVAINDNWIAASCHVDLDDDDLAVLGGPFNTAQVYRDFECLVGNDDDLEDVVSTASHAVITPEGRLNIACKAPLP